MKLTIICSAGIADLQRIYRMTGYYVAEVHEGKEIYRLCWFYDHDVSNYNKTIFINLGDLVIITDELDIQNKQHFFAGLFWLKK